MANAAGWQKYLYIRPETTWGTFDAGGTDLYVPYTTYDVQPIPTFRQPELTTGFRQRRYNEPVNATLSGTLACPIFGQHVGGKSVAQHLIEPCISAPSGLFLDSFTGRLYDPSSDNKRHLGLRANTLTLTGSRDAMSMSLALQGQSEAAEGAIPSLDETTPQPAGARFADVRFFMSSESNAESASGTGEALSIRSFTLTLNNTLQVENENSFWPTIISNGVRVVDFQIELFKTANTYDAFKRSNTLINRAARLLIYAPHLGTASGTYTVIVLEFDRLNFAGASNVTALNSLEAQSVSWIALKPDTTDSELEVNFTLAA